ncbi:MAG: 2'-5' RNA ligase family protein [Nanoarchaeota archaeon]
MRLYVGHEISRGALDFYKKTLSFLDSNEIPIKKSRIPHITLKSPFVISNYRAFSNLIEEFARESKTALYGLEEFCFFQEDSEDITALKVAPSPGFIEMHEALLEKVRSFDPNIFFSPYDSSNKMHHISLVKSKDVGSKLTKRAYDILKDRKIPESEMALDELCIFEKTDEGTRVRERFQLS